MPSRFESSQKEKKLAAHRSKLSERLYGVLAKLDLTSAERSALASQVKRRPRWPYPKPKVVVMPSATGRSATAELAQAIEGLVRGRKFAVEHKGDLTADDYFSLFVPVLHATREQGGGRAREVADAFHNRYMREAYVPTHAEIDKLLIHHSQFDRGLFWVNPSVRELTPCGNVLIYELHFVEPETISVTLDDAPRSAHRCGAPFGRRGVQWVTWRSADMKRPNEDREYPVYVQDHAIRRLHERITLEGPEVVDAMWASLLRPKLIPTSRTDEYLVEYHFFQYLLGYMPVRRLSDKIVVKTFLFLTMDGTPERLRLYERLRLTRPDIAALKLDTLNQFLLTDMQDDPMLRDIFAECGCGHLLDMAKPTLRDRAIRGYARDLKAFLGLDE